LDQRNVNFERLNVSSFVRQDEKGVRTEPVGINRWRTGWRIANSGLNRSLRPRFALIISGKLDEKEHLDEGVSEVVDHTSAVWLSHPSLIWTELASHSSGAACPSQILKPSGLPTIVGEARAFTQ
jgi:hypothetical protein